MDLADWRDIALWIIGFFHLLFAAVVAAIFFFVWRYSRKGFNLLDRVVAERVRPALDAAELQLLAIRDQTARLPGSRGIGLGEAPAPRKKGVALPIPFFRKKRRRFPFLPS
jgi:hypothetical protein